MDKNDIIWFETWLKALLSPMTQIDALGMDGTIALAFGEEYLVAATMERAITYT